MKISIELVDDRGILYAGAVELKEVGKRPSPKHDVVHTPEAVPPPTPPATTKCPGALKLLWQKGFFKQALSLTGVKGELGKLGFDFKDNTLSMALTSAPYLTRRGATGAYTWKQKYPAP